MAERPAGEARYRAFLSYSHKDAAAAGRLHRRLESYRLPKRLVGKETARGRVPERLWPIFRDRDELPAATDLSETVRAALAESGALIILCSSHSAASLWVAEEIETFRKLHPDRPILAAILDGDPPDCFPAALRAFGRDGTWHEPLATDLRPGGDGAHLGLLKLVAGITGVGLDDLVQRDASRRVRRVMAVTGVALLAMLIMAALALVAFEARREAERQRADAERLIEFMLTDLRYKLRGVGRLDVMSTVNGSVLAYYDGQRQSNVRPSAAVMRARVKHRIGEDEFRRRDMRAAAAAFGDAYRSTAALLAQSPGNANIIFAHAQSEYWVGRIHYAADDIPGARRAWQRYKALADGLLAIDANNPRWVRESGYAEGNMCTVAMSRPIDRAGARRTCSIALERMERVSRLQPVDPGLTEDLVNRHMWMAGAWNVNGRWDLARYHEARREALARSLVKDDPSNLDYRDLWMSGQFGFGVMLAEHGLRREAHQRFADAAATAAILHASDPENAEWRNWQRRIAQAMNQWRPQ